MKTHLFRHALVGLFTLAALSIGYGQNAPATPSPAEANPPAPALTAPQGKVPAPRGPVDIANEPTVKVVANVQPAVVNINAQETVPQYVTYYDAFFRRYRGVINRTAQSIGSGLIISADGYVITNAHVVALSEKSVGITLMTGSKYQAQIISVDDEKDLALLKIDDKSIQFPYFDLSYVSPNLLGETVIALGSPEGYQNSVSQGILSAKGRTFTIEGRSYTNLIQTDAAINPGNSGGPLVDLNGGLVGINSAKLSGEAVESIGFAIPHDIVISWANDAMAVARGTKPASVSPTASALQMMRQHLGLSVKTLTADKAQEMNVQLSGGLLITQVEDDSPAASAGLRAGMVIVAIGNREVVDEKSLPHELQRLQAGSKVPLQVIFVQSMGMLTIQRGGSATLIAK